MGRKAVVRGEGGGGMGGAASEGGTNSSAMGLSLERSSSRSRISRSPASPPSDEARYGAAPWSEAAGAEGRSRCFDRTDRKK